MRHPLTHVRAGRYRTRTAAEATAACGGNREPRLGPRSDFSKPCQGAAEKSANATRTGASRQIPSRFPTHRNVYRDDCRFVVDGTGLEQHGHAAGGATNTPVGCLLVRGSQRPGMSTKKDAARLIRVGSFCFGGRYRTRTGTSKGRVSSWRWYPAFCFDMFYQ